MITAFLITVSVLGVSDEAARIFEEANTAYSQGNYEEAAGKYTELEAMHDIHSPALLYNLGNAQYMQGRLGNAVLYYEAALARDPGFEAARKNLEQALGETRRSLPLPDVRQVSANPLVRYYPFSPMQSLLAAHGCLFASLLLLMVRHYATSQNTHGPCVDAYVAACIFFALALRATRRSVRRRNLRLPNCRKYPFISA